MNKQRVSPSVALLFLALPAAAADSPDDPVIVVDHDPEKLVSRIVIQAKDGRVSWDNVLRGIARARGFDDDALQGIVPGNSFKIAGVAAVVAIKAIDRTLAPNIRLDIARVPDDGFDEPRLVIELNRQALLASDRRIGKLLRERLTGALGNTVGNESARRYGLTLDDDWASRDRRTSVVVAMHGINSGREYLEPLLDEPRKHGFACATFEYPNDQPLDDSAALLSRELRKLAKDHPGRPVRLVAHSMGGLVARAVIENPTLDPGTVDRLIMLATPNQGSVLAHFAYGLDIGEYVVEGDLGMGAAQLFYNSIEDGLAEAAVDLRPDSQFLRRLNARQRNPAVRYTIILGTKAHFQRSHVELARRRFASAGENNRWVRFLGPNVDRWLAELDEVVNGQGDGVVAVERGQLAGVSDVLILPFDHSEIMSSEPTDTVRKARQAVMKRLAKD